MAAAVATLLVVAFAAAEWAGWPFLAAPVQHWLTERLQRDVRFSAAGAAADPSAPFSSASAPEPSASAPDTAPRGFALHLFGRVRLAVDALEVGNAEWSAQGPMLQARDARLEWRYSDLFAAWRGRPMRIARVAASSLTIRVERLADGRANWRLGAVPQPDVPPSAPASWEDLPMRIDALSLQEGRLRLADSQQALFVDATLATAPDALDGHAGWVGQAQGRYRKEPVSLSLRTGATGVDLAPDARTDGVPVKLEGRAGRAALSFSGRLADPRGAIGLRGLYKLSGPSLAAVGLPFGVTLPTTAAFSMQGSVSAHDDRWQTTVREARIGRSELGGQFLFERRGADAVPRLSGRLDGRALWLQDLGPAIGAAPDDGKTGRAADAPAAKGSPAAGRILPQRDFNLPSLTVMDADVAVALDRLELGHPRVQSLAPVRARLLLKDGRLQIDDLDARAAQGRIAGKLWLDGSAPVARWGMDLGATGLRLEQWIQQPRSKGQPPYAAGRLSAQLALQGRGRSTAQLLASADGSGWIVWSEGRLSHLALELAGIDVAQALGLMLVGDNALEVSCGAAELQVRDGMVRPSVMVIDTRDSTVWVDGGISLATERLDLTAHVEPKDFSPLALRAPLHVRGTLAAPTVQPDGGRIVRKLLPAALLAAINPLAALLPLIDRGDSEAKPAIEACRRVIERRRTGRR